MLYLNPQDIDNLGLTQEYITEILHDAGLATDRGVEPTTAEDLNVALYKIGLEADETYGLWGLDDQDSQLRQERIRNIDSALAQGKKVIVGYPRQRGEMIFLHYSVISRVCADGHSADFVMDPSEVDGSVTQLTDDGYSDLVTPRYGLPVIAWSVISVRSAQSDESLPEHNDNIRLGERELTDPLYSREHAGMAIPSGSEHPISVAMPTTKINDQFGTYGEVVLSRDGKRPYGYPRFVIDPWVRRLSVETMGSAHWLPFTTHEGAHTALYLAETYDTLGSGIVEKNGLFWIDEDEAGGLNRDAWQYTGMGISSRQAYATLEYRSANDIRRRDSAEQEIKERISSYTNTESGDMYLFSSGMEAINVTNGILKDITPDVPSLQFGFPYTDTFSVQKRFGPNPNIDKNVIDIRNNSLEDLSSALDSGEKIRSVFMEIPSNPLLEVTSLARVTDIINARVPLVLDPTVATMFNLDPDKMPDGVDVQVYSLTKFFSSVGDVMGGVVLLNPQSPFYDAIKAKMESRYVNSVWYEDMEALAYNSREFDASMPVINSNGEQLAQWLHEKYAGPKGPLEAIYYPTLTNKNAYDEVRREGAGYGGLMTFDAKDPQFAYRLYDAMRFTKGPSLGTRYSLACLYTILAHSKELASVEKFGVKRHLIRFSTGIEPFAVLQERFTQACDAAEQS